MSEMMNGPVPGDDFKYSAKTAEEVLSEKEKAVTRTRRAVRQSSSERIKRHRKNRLKKQIIIGTASLILLLLVVYLVGFFVYNGKFGPNTYIMDVKCSGMTVADAEDAIEDSVKDYKLEIIEHDDSSEFIIGKDIDMDVDVSGKLDEIKDKQKAALWFVQLFKKNSYTIEASVTYDKAKLVEIIDGLKACDAEGMVEPVNAFVAYDETKKEFYIDEGNAGSVIVRTALDEAVFMAVSSLAKSLDLMEAGCYKVQEVTADDDILKEQLELVKKHGLIEITLTFGEEKEVLDITEIATWLTAEGDATNKVDADKVNEYVAELAVKYDTIEKDRTLHTTYGYDITVGKGDYGWQMDQAATADKIITAINTGGKQTIDPVWAKEAHAFGTEDWGKTYIEVNITEQHLYYYIDGEVFIESDFVSGTVSKARSTPTGIYYIKYKKSPSILRGINWETPVTYWMPFFDGCGLHDATWRSSFGGTIYYYNGSHGCLNMPFKQVKTIYENIEAGTPILIYKTEVEPVKVVPVHETPWPSGYPTAVPTATPEATATPAPTKAPTKAPTAAPVVTATPAPVVTEAPVITEAPVVTEVPVVTEIPSATEDAGTE